MIGATVGSYHILQKLGEGGVGEVYRARDVMLDRDVAVKVLRPEFAEREDVRERFRTEARTLASLSHPNIAGIHAFHSQDAVQMMVMEFVPGCNLEQRLARAAVSVQDAVELVLQAARGLSYAHGRNIIHRDIKPANLMIDPAGQLKITDFGIARILGGSRLTRQGAVIGTACYMAPEQIRGEQGDVRTDIYALAIVLYELLAGRPPFGGDSDYEILRSQVERRPPPLRLCRRDLPKGIEQFLARALQKNPQSRQQSMDEVIAELTNCLPDAAAQCPERPSSAVTAIRPARAVGRRLLALGITGCLMAAVGGLAWVGPLAPSAPASPDVWRGPAARAASAVAQSPTPEEEQSAPPVSALPVSAPPVSVPPETSPPRPEADAIKPSPDLHPGQPSREADAPRVAQPQPAPEPVEVGILPAPGPVVQPPPVAEPAAPAEPGHVAAPDASARTRAKPVAARPPSGTVTGRRGVQSCSSAWSINWHGSGGQSCAR